MLVVNIAKLGHLLIRKIAKLVDFSVQNCELLRLGKLLFQKCIFVNIAKLGHSPIGKIAKLAHIFSQKLTAT